MKKVDERWVDSNNNSWNCNTNTKKQAEEKSKSLINCWNCWNCRDCWNCWNCWNCRDCWNCWNCRDCWSCWNCWNCRNCRGCQDCQDCQDFKSNPFRIFFQDIGSRNSETKIYWDCFGDTQVICGCFNGNISRFIKAISNTHKDNKYATRYINLINQVFTLMEV